MSPHPTLLRRTGDVPAQPGPPPPAEAAAGRLAAARPWSPTSWRHRPAAQQPEWDDSSALEAALQELRQQPPLVSAGEARALTDMLAMASRGEAFVLQAGECAESFDTFSAESVRDQLRIILQMSAVLTYGGLPVVKIGRIAGQFAKPRSSATERIGDRELPSFRGHAVNGSHFDAVSRRAEPRRLLRAYHQASATLNLLRAFTKGGFADLAEVHRWDRELTGANGFDPKPGGPLHDVDFYTSHEALILPFEEALTRRDSLDGDWYDCSAHLVWAGERTRGANGAHIEFLSGLKNPVACKVGPEATPEDVLELCERLDPDGEPGRLTFIARMGARAVRDALPPLVGAVRDARRPVVWVCDPMHGNTFLTPAGVKTRRFEDIVDEIKGFFAVHRDEGTVPGGVHLELTPDDVSECVGGRCGLTDDDLSRSYRTLCDPRLNGKQSLELAFEVAELLHAWARQRGGAAGDAGGGRKAGVALAPDVDGRGLPVTAPLDHLIERIAG